MQLLLFTGGGIAGQGVELLGEVEQAAPDRCLLGGSRFILGKGIAVDGGLGQDQVGELVGRGRGALCFSVSAS